MKVLLINPPNENEITGSLPSFVSEERGYYPPLGLLYVAGYLKEHSEHSVKIIDSQVERLSWDLLRGKILSAKPDVVGITAMTVTLVDVIKTIQIIKEINNKIKVILGGPHVHLFPEETISLDGVDYLVLGEGEETFKELLDNLEDDFNLRLVRGIVYKSNGTIINTGLRPLIDDLDKIPFPARYLTPYKEYNSLLSKGRMVTTMFTSRGCPFKCAFCDRPHLGKTFRARSAENVVAEIEACTKMGIYDFMFYDDTFTVNKKRVLDICNRIIEKKLDISWDIRTRIDTVDEEILENIKKAGCQGIHYGVEAGTEKILKILNKGITISQAQKVFSLTKKYKIPILAYFMIGNPTETREDIYRTFAVAKMLDPDYVHMTILTPFPGTKIYLDGLKNGDITKDYWQEFASNPMSEFKLPYWKGSLSHEELNSLLGVGYKKFYLRFFYILRSIFKLRSLKELKKKIHAGFRVLCIK